MRQRPLLVLASLAICTTASCSAMTRAAGAASDVAASAVLPIDQEIALGHQLRAQIDSELTAHPNAELQAYIARLGATVVAAAQDRDSRIEFTFTVVDDDATVNAFAIPGGHIYMYTGLLLAADSEAEVVAVLCHEVAHVTRRHIAQRLVAMYGLQTVANMALGQSPGMIAQLGAEVASTGVLLRYSRSAESDADSTGFDTMIRVGYDPQGFIDFFSKLTGGPRPPEFLSSHPNPENRVEAIRAMIRARSNVPTRRNVEEYTRMKALI